MIISFGNSDTEKIWNGERIKRLPKEIQETGRRKLRMLNNSFSIKDLIVPPSNRLEKLSGSLRGYHSIGINDQWRIIFRWIQNNATDVDIIDYH